MTEPSARVFNVLFICTGNSARSILAECALNRIGEGRFKGYSAGSMPKGEVHPEAIKLLSHLGFDVSGLRSKSWEEFIQPGAPEMDFTITVCDNAAGEVCPIWPGQPITAHWGMPDPAAVTGTETEVALAFADTYRMLSNRIALLVNLPVEKLSHMSLKQHMDAIGRSGAAQAAG